MFKVTIIDKLSMLLVLIGAINWGTIGLFNFNFVKLLTFKLDFLERSIYILVFAGAIDLIILLSKLFYSSCKHN